jgi:hypothetical protein
MLNRPLLALALLLPLVACGDKDGDSGSTGAGADGADGSTDGADGSTDGTDGAADGTDGAADGADGTDGTDGSTDGTDGSSTSCVATDLGDTSAAFARAAGVYAFSSATTSNEATAPWTNGTTYSVTVEASGRVVYGTDDGERDCCWDGANFDTVYGTVGESDLNIVIAEADNSNCGVNWSESTGTLGRFSVQSSDFEVSALY